MILADWAALAIDNARLHEDAARRRDEPSERWRGSRRRRRSRAPSEARPTSIACSSDRQARPSAVRRAPVVLLLAEGDQLQLAAVAGQVSSTAIGGRFPSPGRPPARCCSPGARRARRCPGAAAFRCAASARPSATACSCRSSTVTCRSACSPRSTASRRPSSATKRSGSSSFAASAATAVATARSVAEDRLRHRWPRPSRSAAAGRASCTTRRCRGSAASRCCSPRRCARARREALEQSAREAIEHISTEIDEPAQLITELRPAALDESASRRRSRASASGWPPSGARGRARRRGRRPARPGDGDDRLPARPGGADQRRQARRRRGVRIR